MSSSSGSSSAISLDHHHHPHPHPPPPPPPDHLCYVHCTRCDTVLAVSVPASSLFKAVTVRCGHCGSLLPLNFPALLPAVHTQQHSSIHNHNPYSTNPHNHLGEMTNQPPHFSLSQPNVAANYMTPMSVRGGGPNEHPKPLPVNRPPEKRQRVPSAYNRFIKDEIQRIKAGNPEISHREAFSAAAKNWAHFPHIHFGLMADQALKRTTTNNINMRPHHSQFG